MRTNSPAIFQKKLSAENPTSSTCSAPWPAAELPFYQSCYFACEALGLLISCCFYSSAAPAGVFCVFARSPLRCRVSFCFFCQHNKLCQGSLEVNTDYNLRLPLWCRVRVDERRCEGRWGLYVLELIGLTWKLICEIRATSSLVLLIQNGKKRNKNTTKPFITILQFEVINYWAEGSGPEARATYAIKWSI